MWLARRSRGWRTPVIQEYEARIAALERLVGKQALELEFLKGAGLTPDIPRRADTSFLRPTWPTIIFQSGMVWLLVGQW